MDSAGPSIPVRTSSKRRAETSASGEDEESLEKKREDLNRDTKSSRKKLKPQQSFDAKYVVISRRTVRIKQLLIYLPLKVLD
jgi:hypothetical protein